MESKELTYEEFSAIEEFTNEIKQCYEKALEEAIKENDNITQIVLEYAIKTINLHLKLAEIKFNMYSLNMQKVLNKEV